MFFVLETVWQKRQRRGNEREEETRDKNRERNKDVNTADGKKERIKGS